MIGKAPTVLPPIQSGTIIAAQTGIGQQQLDLIAPKVQISLHEEQVAGHPLLARTFQVPKPFSLRGFATRVALAGTAVLSAGCEELPNRINALSVGVTGGVVLFMGGLIAWGIHDMRKHTRSAYCPVRETRLLPTREKLYAKGYDVKSWQRFVRRYVIKKKCGGSLEKAMAIANKRGFDMWNRFWDPRTGRLDSHSVWQLADDYDFHPSMPLTAKTAYAFASTGLRFKGTDSTKHMRFLARMATVEHGRLASSIEAALKHGYPKPFAKLISEGSHVISADLLDRYKPQALTLYLARYYQESHRSQMASGMRKAYTALLQGDNQEAIRLNRYVMKHLEHRTNFEQSIAWALHNILLALTYDHGWDERECVRNAFEILCHPKTRGIKVLRSLGLGSFEYATIHSPHDAQFNPWHREPEQPARAEPAFPVYYGSHDEGISLEEGLLLASLFLG